MKKIFAVIFLVISFVYLINPTAGLFELIPDNVPILGNLDEAFFAGLFLYCLRCLGIDLFAKGGEKSPVKQLPN